MKKIEVPLTALSPLERELVDWYWRDARRLGYWFARWRRVREQELPGILSAAEVGLIRGVKSAMRQIERFESESHFKSHLTRNVLWEIRAERFAGYRKLGRRLRSGFFEVAIDDVCGEHSLMADQPPSIDIEGIEAIDDIRVVRQAIEELPQQYQTVLKGYFLEEKMLREIGDELGLTRERIRQVKEKALDKLRERFQVA